MILSFKTELNGSPTCFREKILVHLGKDAILKYFNGTDELSQQVAHEGLAWIKPKKFTIRDDPNNRWQAGRKIHFATGARTKKYECFAMSKCKDTAHLAFHFYSDGTVSIDVNGKSLDHAEIDQLVKDDGFKTFKDFRSFHVPKIPANGFVTKTIIYF